MDKVMLRNLPEVGNIISSDSPLFPGLPSRGIVVEIMLKGHCLASGAHAWVSLKLLKPPEGVKNFIWDQDFSLSEDGSEWLPIPPELST